MEPLSLVAADATGSEIAARARMVAVARISRILRYVPHILQPRLDHVGIGGDYLLAGLTQTAAIDRKVLTSSHLDTGASREIDLMVRHQPRFVRRLASLHAAAKSIDLRSATLRGANRWLAATHGRVDTAGAGDSTGNIHASHLPFEAFLSIADLCITFLIFKCLSDE